MTETWWWLISALAGYLIGGISFARLAFRLAGQQPAVISMDVPGSDDHLISRAVSATTVRLQLGPRYGCLVSIADMLKAALPALALRFALPGQPYFLMYGAMSVIGHIWTPYYAFRGGRGQSPSLGALLAADWLATLVTQAVASLLGLFVIRNTLVNNFGGLVLIMAWFALVQRDWRYVLFAAVILLAYVLAMRDELRQIMRFKREGKLRTLDEEAQMMDMTRGMGRMGERFERLFRVRRPPG